MTESALQQFEASLEMPQALLLIERNSFSNPPKLSEQKPVQGLRGGAIVLCVASFENFLKRLIEEQLGEIKLKIGLYKLPDKLQANGVFKALESAMRGPLYQPTIPRKDRLPAIDNACKQIIAGNLDPVVFCDVSSNPNSKNVKSLFNDVSLDDIFLKIKPQFDRKWGSPTAGTFIQDKLDEIVNRRHVVAHNADALKITRTELNQALKFLRTLAVVLDAQMRAHVKHLIKTCT